MLHPLNENTFASSVPYLIRRSASRAHLRIRSLPSSTLPMKVISFHLIALQTNFHHSFLPLSLTLRLLQHLLDDLLLLDQEGPHDPVAHAVAAARAAVGAGHVLAGFGGGRVFVGAEGGNLDRREGQ